MHVFGLPKTAVKLKASYICSVMADSRVRPCTERSDGVKKQKRRRQSIPPSPTSSFCVSDDALKPYISYIGNM